MKLSRNTSFPRLPLLTVTLGLLGLLFVNEILAQSARKNDRTELIRLLSDMQTVTSRALSSLRQLASRKIPEQRIIDEIGAVADPHMRVMSTLAARLDQLPRQVKDAFFRSPRGADQLRRLNTDLKAMSQIAENLTAGLPGARFRFDNLTPQAAVAALDGPAKWPASAPKAVEAQYVFIRSYLLGLTPVDEGKRAAALGGLEEFRQTALRGNTVAAGQLNAFLTDVLQIYPKTQRDAQYNLGLLYIGLGQDAEAARWLSLAAAQGDKQAEIALREMQPKK
jgi:hypothetical protein